MPFSNSIRNPHLINEYLAVTIAGKEQALDLNTCLGNINGKFRWGGQGFFFSARNVSLMGHVLSGDLKRDNGQWASDQIDLGERVQVVGGKLVYVAPNLGNGRAPIPDAEPQPHSPPPSYTEANKFGHEFRKFKSTNKSTYSARSASYFKFSVQSLSLQGSTLRAECLQIDGKKVIHSELDLDSYIGIVDGNLVWGRTGFYSACKNVKLEGFTLKAEYESTSSSIDLSRYLQTYDGKLGIKVEAISDDLSDLFSEARWMKFKILTELDASGAFTVINGEKSAFKSAFSALAETTSKHVVAEMTQELSEEAEQFVEEVVTDRVKSELTKIISHRISEQVQEEVSKKVKEAFETAQTAVLEACNAMVKAAAGDLNIQHIEKVVGPMKDQITTRCKGLVQSTLTEVSASAIGQFQERAEILMEREIIRANIRRAQTKANLLKMLMENEAF